MYIPSKSNTPNAVGFALYFISGTFLQSWCFILKNLTFTGDFTSYKVAISKLGYLISSFQRHAYFFSQRKADLSIFSGGSVCFHLLSYLNLESSALKASSYFLGGSNFISIFGRGSVRCGLFLFLKMYCTSFASVFPVFQLSFF